MKIWDEERLVCAAQSGDRDAFGTLVERYRNRVYGLAYDRMGDFDRARDAAQEAFVRAFLRMNDLRDPKKFASWIRQMTVNECRQMRRRDAGRWQTGIPAEWLERQSVVGSEETLGDAIEKRVIIQQALQCLTLNSRRAILLFYFHGRSLEEIAAFLNTSVSSVKSRLRDARARLRREMLTMIEETIQAEPLPATFSEEVVRRLFDAAYKGDAETVRALVNQDERLTFVRRDFPGFYRQSPPLIVAAECNNTEIIALLRERGAFDDLRPEDEKHLLHLAAFHQNRALIAEMLAHGVPLDIFAACQLGDAEPVRAFLMADATLVHTRDDAGATPLHGAATPEVAQILLDAGADLEATDTLYGNTPAEYLSRPSRTAVVDYLTERGAHINFHLACARDDAARVAVYLDADPAWITARQGNKRPEGNTLPINIAAGNGARSVVALLLDRGADVNSRDDERGGATPLHFAALWGNASMARLLLERGADADLRANFIGPTFQDATPLIWAREGQREGWGTELCWRGSGKHDEVIALLEPLTIIKVGTMEAAVIVNTKSLISRE